MVEEQVSDTSLADSSNKEEKITLSSRKKWFWLGVIIALLNPIFSGLVVGIAFWAEPDLRKEGKIITVLSLAWGILSLYFFRWLVARGYLPAY